jgi:hypothetical protein
MLIINFQRMLKFFMFLFRRSASSLHSVCRGYRPWLESIVTALAMIAGRATHTSKHLLDSKDHTTL